MTIINRRTPLGGAVYPFLHRLNRPWALISYDVTTSDVPRTQAPVLRWVHDSNVHDLYVDGMATAEFLAATGLQLNLRQGGFVLSKRLSRVMRPHFISACLPIETVSTRYLTQTDTEASQWDGIGLVSRSFLHRLIGQLPDTLSSTKRRQLVWELEQGYRFEFTLLTHRGQDKGHLLVMDELNVDFVLPSDTKTEVKLLDGTAFVGLHPVHSRDDMRLDVQSLIHLYPFFSVSQLVDWLNDEGDWFLHSVETGEIADVMARVDGDATLEDIQSWYVREYYLRGGHPMWFRSVAKATINQHLKRLGQTVYQNLRLPIPGGRYYVAVDCVGNREVARGRAELDPTYATIWVNHMDWVEYMAEVLGGADQDDALWVFPFTDIDDQVKLLCWRSPNQAGEYVILQPTEPSHLPRWQTNDGVMCHPQMDSRQLPPRIDTMQMVYAGLIPDHPVVAVEVEYDVQHMADTIQRAVSNKGILGQYVNVLMLAQAIDGQSLRTLPAPLEAVIDGCVKTGADLSAIRDWCYRTCKQMLSDEIPIPMSLQDRLSVDPQQRALVRTSEGHWLDVLLDYVDDHIIDIRQRRQVLMLSCMPPLDLFAHVLHRADSLRLGAQFNGLYARAVANRDQYEDPFQLPREQTTTFLLRFCAEGQEQLLLGALVNVYLNDDGRMDSACWQMGTNDDPSIAQRTLTALQNIGVLNAISDTNSSYPIASVPDTPLRRIEIRGVWFHWWCAHLQSQGRQEPKRMGDVSTEETRWAKQCVTQLARTRWQELQLIQETGDETYCRWRTPNGNVFGVTGWDELDDGVPETIQLRHCLVRDGNVIGLVS